MQSVLLSPSFVSSGRVSTKPATKANDTGMACSREIGILLHADSVGRATQIAGDSSASASHAYLLARPPRPLGRDGPPPGHCCD
eukprot:scaffold169920_cov43-Prasinocladus_malaysianus.AAC.1